MAMNPRMQANICDVLADCDRRIARGDHEHIEQAEQPAYIRSMIVRLQLHKCQGPPRRLWKLDQFMTALANAAEDGGTPDLQERVVRERERSNSSWIGKLLAHGSEVFMPEYLRSINYRRPASFRLPASQRKVDREDGGREATGVDNDAPKVVKSTRDATTYDRTRTRESSKQEAYSASGKSHPVKDELRHIDRKHSIIVLDSGDEIKDDQTSKPGALVDAADDHKDEIELRSISVSSFRELVVALFGTIEKTLKHLPRLASSQHDSCSGACPLVEAPEARLAELYQLAFQTPDWNDRFRELSDSGVLQPDDLLKSLISAYVFHKIVCHHRPWLQGGAKAQVTISGTTIAAGTLVAEAKILGFDIEAFMIHCALMQLHGDDSQILSEASQRGTELYQTLDDHLQLFVGAALSQQERDLFERDLAEVCRPALVLVEEWAMASEVFGCMWLPDSATINGEEMECVGPAGNAGTAAELALVMFPGFVHFERTGARIERKVIFKARVVVRS